ncbi:unnamed protein product [Tenebrio molitor]|nr:unnamed protein product [Tenebrio molitor]
MPPNNTIVTHTSQVQEISTALKADKFDTSYRTLWESFKTPLIWTNIIGMFSFHLIAIVGLIIFPYFDHELTIIWAFLTGWAAGFGVTGGAHRLWSHRSYKATPPLRIILLICYAVAGQNKLSEWVRNHRVHHKFSETDADPHNANRGFFFAHVGWLMMKKHPEVLRRGKQVDFSDLFEDPLVVVFEKYFWAMKLLFCFILPSMVPYFLWNETMYWSVVSSITRDMLSLNFT